MNGDIASARSPGGAPAGWVAPRVVNPLEEPGWDEQVAALDGSSFFHGSSWARVLHTAYGHRPMYFGVVEEGRLRAVLPLMEVSSPLTGTRGVSLPFSDECQPVGFGARDFQEVLQAVLRVGQARRWRYWECRGGGALAGEGSSSRCHFGHTLDLRPGEEALFQQFKGAVRQAIRKAERHGLKSQLTTASEALEVYYRMHCRTRQKHGVPPQPWSFFSRIHEHVLARGHGFLSLVTHEEKPIAGGIFLTMGRRALFKYGASDEGSLVLRGNNLQMWQAIQWLCRHGFEQLDFGRTAPTNAGLRRFKQAWGTTEKRIDYVRFDLRAGRFVREPTAHWAWCESIVRRVPSAISRLAGALLCRHLSSWVFAPEAFEAGLFA